MWMRLEIYIFYASVISMMVFIVIYVSFKKKKTTVHLSISDLKLDTKVCDTDDYFVTMVDDDEDGNLDAINLTYRDSKDVQQTKKIELKEIIDMIGQKNVSNDIMISFMSQRDFDKFTMLQIILAIICVSVAGTPAFLTNLIKMLNDSASKT